MESISGTERRTWSFLRIKEVVEKGREFLEGQRVEPERQGIRTVRWGGGGVDIVWKGSVGGGKFWAEVGFGCDLKVEGVSTVVVRFLRH